MESRDLVIDALGWVRDNLDSFHPRSEAGVDETALAELSVLCMCLARCPSPGRRDWVKGVLEFIVPICTSSEFRERLARTGTPFASRVQMFNALRCCGVRVPGSDLATVQRLVDQGNVAHPGKSPHRLMELRYALDLGGFTHRLPGYAALCDRSILAAPGPNLAYLTDFDAYSITHILFYLSDLGSRPVSVASRGFKARARGVVRQLLGMYIRARNWDLVGELLLCDHCLGGRKSVWYDLGWKCLAGAQLPSGAMPGPRHDQTRPKGRPGADWRIQEFRQCYHSTIVACIAGVVCPRPVLERAVREHGHPQFLGA